MVLSGVWIKESFSNLKRRFCKEISSFFLRVKCTLTVQFGIGLSIKGKLNSVTYLEQLKRK